jgi:hypothetical protein
MSRKVTTAVGGNRADAEQRQVVEGFHAQVAQRVGEPCRPLRSLSAHLMFTMFDSPIRLKDGASRL